jgi:ribose transport system substrate-binding protein
MRKTLVTIVALMLAIALFAGASAEAVKYAKTEYHLVFIPKLVHEWYEEVKQGIDTAVAELAEQGITVTYSWDPPTDAVVTDQIAKIESAVATSPDAISIAVIDASATNSVINELVASGVKMCTFDCDAPDSNRYYYCGHAGNYDDGFYMGETLAKKLDYKGEVAILAGTLSAGNHQDRVKGFKAAIAQYPDMTVVAEQADNDSVEVALSVMEGWISAYPDLKGVIGVNAASPIGAARAVTDAGKVGQILIVGMAENQEAMEYVKSGTILCTLKQQVPVYGYNSVYNMLLIADGKEPTVKVDEIPANYVTIDNVDQFLK